VIEERLPGLLAELAEDVDAPPMGRAAWVGARRVRRRRMLLAAASSAAGVAALTAVVTLAAGTRDLPPEPAGTPTRTATPSPDAAREPRVLAGPRRGEVAALPVLDTPLAALNALPVTAPEISTAPLPRVVAAGQRPGGPVLLAGPDGAWRRVEDLGGEPATLGPASISPDGGRVALVQPGGLVVVDASTGESRLLEIRGPAAKSLQAVAWLADGTHVVVGGDAGDVVVSTADGTQGSTTLRAGELATGRVGEPTVELTGTGFVVHPVATAPLVVPLSGSGVEQWYGGAWPEAGRVAGTGFRPGSEEQAVAVVDTPSGRVTHLLELPYGGPPDVRSQGCCATLGWLDPDTVLLRDGGHVLAWRPASAEVLRVARLPEATTRGADPGYDVTVAVHP
jgi:hypothetical protein